MATSLLFLFWTELYVHSWLVSRDLKINQILLLTAVLQKQKWKKINKVGYSAAVFPFEKVFCSDILMRIQALQYKWTAVESEVPFLAWKSTRKVVHPSPFAILKKDLQISLRIPNHDLIDYGKFNRVPILLYWRRCCGKQFHKIERNCTHYIEI